MPSVLICPERMRFQEGPHTEILRRAGFDICYPKNPVLAQGTCSDEETISELRGIAATMASVERYTRRVLEACPELRVIARTGVGYDAVDVEAATDHGVVVTITPGTNQDAVAELALALMLSVAKRLVVNDRLVRAGQWPRDVLAPLRGRVLGIIGLGRIGRATAVKARALGMTVLAYETQPDHEFLQREGIELVEMEELLARSDYVSLHCPLNDQTEGFFDAQLFSKMKPGSVFINTARGKLVNEADLCAALESGHLRAAGLDVFAEEPPSADNPLLKMDNVVLSPHMAGADEASSEAMACKAAECIVQLYQGGWPEDSVVNHSLREGWHG